jgi:hypothetical protein
MIKCGNCSFKLLKKSKNDNEKDTYCNHCGFYLGGKKCLEPDCGQINPLGTNSIYCSACGRPSLSKGATIKSQGCIAPFVLFIFFSITTGGMFLVGLSTGFFSHVADLLNQSGVRLGQGEASLEQALMPWFVLFFGISLLTVMFIPSEHPFRKLIAVIWKLPFQFLFWILSGISRIFMQRGK